MHIREQEIMFNHTKNYHNGNTIPKGKYRHSSNSKSEIKWIVDASYQ